MKNSKTTRITANIKLLENHPCSSNMNNFDKMYFPFHAANLPSDIILLVYLSISFVNERAGLSKI